MKHEAHNRSSVEVELNAGELSQLARSADDEMSRAALRGFMALDCAEQTNRRQAPATKVAARSSSWQQRFAGARAVGILGSVVVAGIAVAAHFEYSESKRVAPPAPVAWTPLPERPQEVVLEEAPPPPPTRYVNPFDKSEVFELPPGLTKDEARDMVAQLLLDRARERVR